MAPTFRQVLFRHYAIGAELAGAIDLLDAFVSEIIGAYDELCLTPSDEGTPRYKRAHSAARELDGSLEPRMTFRHRYLYYAHIISRYALGDVPSGSCCAAWRAHYIQNLQSEIEELRREYASRAPFLPQEVRSQDPFVL